MRATASTEAQAARSKSVAMYLFMVPEFIMRPHAKIIQHRFKIKFLRCTPPDAVGREAVVGRGPTAG